MGSNPIFSGGCSSMAERMLCKHEVTGSSPVISRNRAFVAQSVERSHGKGKVSGSSPAVGIKKRVLYAVFACNIQSI